MDDRFLTFESYHFKPSNLDRGLPNDSENSETFLHSTFKACSMKSIHQNKFLAVLFQKYIDKDFDGNEYCRAQGLILLMSKLDDDAELKDILTFWLTNSDSEFLNFDSYCFYYWMQMLSRLFGYYQGSKTDTENLVPISRKLCYFQQNLISLISTERSNFHSSKPLSAEFSQINEFQLPGFILVQCSKSKLI